MCVRVRYPFYTLRIIHREVSFVTWLRYTIWIPLYPLGVITEGVLYLRYEEELTHLNSTRRTFDTMSMFLSVWYGKLRDCTPRHRII